MLRRFEVENFKGFQQRLCMDFVAGDHDFNTEIIKNGLVNKAIVYGKNGSGKSSLGIAIFDIIHHLTDKNRMRSGDLSNYRNLETDKKEISFLYEFQFDDQTIQYEYEKSDVDTLLHERLRINGKIVLDYSFSDRTDNYISDEIRGDLNMDILHSSSISVVRYIYKNSPSNAIPAITRLMDFCDRMLWYRCLSDGNAYAGYMVGGKSLAKVLYENGLLSDFEAFLDKMDLHDGTDKSTS